MLRKNIAYSWVGHIGRRWPIPSYTGDYCKGKDNLLNAFQEIKPHIKINTSDITRILFLKNLERQARLQGPAIFYPAGGSDAITAFLLSPNTNTVILTGLGNVYNLKHLEKPGLYASFIQQYSLFSRDNSYSMELSMYDDSSIIEMSLRYDEQTRNSLLLRDLVRMYLLDEFLLTDIIPFDLGFKMVYKNQTTTKTIVYIPADYSVASKRNQNINSYIRETAQTGLDVVIKAPLDLFDTRNSLGYYNLYNTLHGLTGRILYDQFTNQHFEHDFCQDPKILDCNGNYFGYYKEVNLCDFSQLINPLTAYHNSLLFKKVKKFYQDKPVSGWQQLEVW